MILTCNRPEELADALEGLRRQTVQIDQYVIINNSTSIEPTQGVIRAFSKRTSSTVVCLRGDPVFGTASGKNAGLDEATGSFVFLFDDDLLFPDSGYVEKVIDVFHRDPGRSIGVVTTAAQGPERVSWTREARRSARSIAKRFFGLEGPPGTVTRSGFQSPQPRGRISDVDWMYGGVTALRDEVARAVRFDVGLELRPLAFSDDLEYGLQVRKKWRIVFLGTVYAINGHVRRGKPGSQWIDERTRYELMVVSYDRIHRRHRAGFKDRAAFWWAITGVGVERLARFPLASPGALDGWRGYVRGIRSVLAGGREASLSPRRVERVDFSTLSDDPES